jgi:small multidrug resistance pump
MSYFYLFLAILLEVIATSLLKKTDGFTVFAPSLVVIGGYMLAFYFLSLTLNTIPVGVAYAIWSGVGIVILSLVGLVFYKQLLDIPTIVGIGFIVSGIVLINIFSKPMP